MENININDFLFEVDQAILWLTERSLFNTLHCGVKESVEVIKDDKQTSCEVLEELIKEAPDGEMREWLESQLDKKSKTIIANSCERTKNATQIPNIQLNSKRPRDNWIEELERKSNNSMREAKEIITKNNLKAYLCSALQTLSNDTFEIANVTTPILLGLVGGGILIIPLSPMIFAAIALIIARSGIASFCVGYKRNASEEK